MSNANPNQKQDPSASGKANDRDPLQGTTDPGDLQPQSNQDSQNNSNQNSQKDGKNESKKDSNQKSQNNS